jgi:hypothetical protein
LPAVVVPEHYDELYTSTGPKGMRGTTPPPLTKIFIKKSSPIKGRIFI